MNPQIESIYQADQADRQRPDLWEEQCLQIDQRDKLRLQQVLSILDTLSSPEELYYAAMIFQHGSEPKDFEEANKLAEKSMNLGYEPAKWLFAASLDRYLCSIGENQKFGTQYQLNPDGSKEYFPIDPKTTPIDRKKYNVPEPDK